MAGASHEPSAADSNPDRGELKEVFEIDRAAGILAALIEAQHQEKGRFEQEMAREKERLSGEIESLRAQWKQEKAEHDIQVKEQGKEQATED